MLGQAKPLASLSSTLLARKGSARPAMRPQGYASLAPAAQLEDLGWDDMGSEPRPAPPPTPIDATVAPLVAAAPPPVLVARQALREEFATAVDPINPPAGDSPVSDPSLGEASVVALAPTAVTSVSVATAGRLQRETAHAGRAAFTLRLDADSHLKLRLASAVTHRSAQQLVAHALDQFLLTLPQVDRLVAQLPATPRLGRKR